MAARRFAVTIHPAAFVPTSSCVAIAGISGTTAVCMTAVIITTKHSAGISTPGGTVGLRTPPLAVASRWVTIGRI